MLNQQLISGTVCIWKTAGWWGPLAGFTSLAKLDPQNSMQAAQCACSTCKIWGRSSAGEAKPAFLQPGGRHCVMWKRAALLIGLALSSPFASQK